MYHARRLAQGTKLHQAAAKLTKTEFKQLQEILQVVKQRDAADAAGVEKGALPLMDIAEKTRSLKKGNSDTSHVSMDASGFPCMFASPSSSSKPLEKASSPLGKGEAPLKKTFEKRKNLSQQVFEKTTNLSQKVFEKRKNLSQQVFEKRKNLSQQVFEKRKNLSQQVFEKRNNLSQKAFGKRPCQKQQDEERVLAESRWIFGKRSKRKFD